MIDSHCHLASKEFTEDYKDVIARAKAAGVLTMITIGDTIKESKRCVELAEEVDELFATVGVHPHESKNWDDRSETELRKLVKSSKKVKAIGEIGLDYHYNFSAPEIQRDVFEKQLRLAQDLKLPVVVHCREAVEDLWKIVSAVKPEKLVIHCCTEKFEDVKRFVDSGYLLSFTGIATYKNGGVIRDAIKQTPLSQIMIETDAPYLAPVPHRNKRNEPAFVTEVAKLIAELKGISVDKVDSATTKNTVEFFGLLS